VNAVSAPRRLYLVRHGKPAASWGEDPDPGLDALGAAQARATAAELAAQLRAPLHLYTSPLRRCRETAAPLAQLWNRDAVVFPAVAEIPTPPLALPAARRDWLSNAMSGTWQQLNDSAPPGSIDYLRWRRDVIEALGALPHDSVIYTHYIAINVAVGAALARDSVLCFRPDHASVTLIEAQADGVRLVALGREAQTAVLAR
jgi:broad specificity phosphatase PhoE